MGSIESCAELASNLGSIVSPSRYEFDWGRYPKGINDPAYILGGIGPAFDRASKIYQTLDLPPPDPSKVVSAWKVFLDEATRIKGDFFSWKTAVLATVPIIGPTVLIPAQLSWKVSNSVYGGMITALFYTAVTGAFGHIAFKDASTREFSIHKMVIDGTLSEKTAMEHAAWAYTAFQLIVVLDELRMLAPLKKPGMSGAMGALPLVPIVIGAVAAVLIIAGAVVLSKNLSEVNSLRARVVEEKIVLMKETCAKTTDPKIIAQCAAGPTADDLSAGTMATELSKALAKTGSDLARYVVIGLGIFAAIELLPHFIGKAKDAKEAAAS